VLEGAESEEGATSIAVRRDGAEAGIAIGDRIIEYRMDSGQVLRQLPEVPGKVRDLAWSPDGARLLVTLLGDPDARLVDAATGEAVRRIPVAQEAAAVAFGQDGKLAAVGSEIGPIVVFDPGSDAPPRPLADVLQPVETIAFAGQRVMWAGADRSLRVWDAGSGASLVQAPLTEAAVRLAVSPDGRVAAIVLRSGAIELRRSADGGLVDTLRWHRSGVRAVAWAGPLLVSGDNGGAVAIWDLAAFLAIIEAPIPLR
jgi:WD40 repeat protein